MNKVANIKITLEFTPQNKIFYALIVSNNDLRMSYLAKLSFNEWRNKALVLHKELWANKECREQEK